MLYELKFLTKAFPRGQRGNPPIPSNLSDSGIFSSVLPKYLLQPFLVLLFFLFLWVFLLRMLEKDCLVRITSRRLSTELEDLLDDENNQNLIKFD